MKTLPLKLIVLLIFSLSIFGCKDKKEKEAVNPDHVEETDDNGGNNSDNGNEDNQGDGNDSDSGSSGSCSDCSPTDICTGVSSNSYLPLAEDAKWRLGARSNFSSGLVYNNMTIEGTETVNDTLYYLYRPESMSTRTYQLRLGDDGNIYVRYHTGEILYFPAEPTVGTYWTKPWDSTEGDSVVVSNITNIQTDSCSYSNAVVVDYFHSNEGSRFKTRYYVKGIGVVREQTYGSFGMNETLRYLDLSNY
ncbi:hypothetical protein RCC89_13120 [Cytophagaceae bacterium ABcell3]|nr:hypothetical protein RCC89_13120 [Cytophagaceae bacterium ABcell3]